MNLVQKKCQSCNKNTPKLTIKEMDNLLNQVKNWTINDNKEMIFKKFNFKNFNEALIFTNKVANIAEEEGHQPDISLGWGYCLIMIHTHAIKGLSENDFILASKIDLLNG